MPVTPPFLDGTVLTAAQLEQLQVAGEAVSADDITGTLGVAHGGTGQTTFASGQLLVGNASGTLTKATLTPGANISIVDGDGAITIAANPTDVDANDLTGTKLASNVLESSLTSLGALTSLVVDGVQTITLNSASDGLTIAQAGAGNAISSNAQIKVNYSLWPTLAANGANWGSRDAFIMGMSDVGRQGVSGFAKSSLGAGVGAPIGTSGFVINDYATGYGWALYGDVQHESGASWSAGLELALKNKGSSVTRTPYTKNNGLSGVWLFAGGDSAYGGNPTAPVMAGMVFVAPQVAGNGFNTGITFDYDSLEFSGGLAKAMHLGENHVLQWANTNTAAAARIYSSTTTAVDHRLIFSDSGVCLTGTSALNILRAEHVANSVSYWRFQNAATGTNPTLRVISTDTNCGLTVSSQGSGVINLYTNGAASLAAQFGHVASAVNFPEIKGGATGIPVQFSAQGSDGTVGWAFSSKGGASMRFFTGGSFTNEAFRILHTASSVNYPQALPSATGNAAGFSLAGSDTDIDFVLTPKGAGVVRFGTRTALGAETVTGYITIKDSGGTTRKLAVVS